MTSPDRTPAGLPTANTTVSATGQATGDAATARALPSVPAPSAALVEGVDVDALAAAVRACPAVAELSPGPLGSVATYLPGRRVPGVVVRAVPAGGIEVEIHVVAGYGPTMATVAEQVHTVAAAQVPGATTTVSIDDVAIPS